MHRQIVGASLKRASQSLILPKKKERLSGFSSLDDTVRVSVSEMELMERIPSQFAADNVAESIYGTSVSCLQIFSRGLGKLIFSGMG